MFKYSKRSIAALGNCHPDLKILFMEVIKFYDNTILCGERSKKEQTEAFNNGVSQVEWPDSPHNKLPSLAVDSAPYPIDWDTEKELLEKYTKAMADGNIDALEKNDIDNALNALKRWYSFGGYVKATADRLGIKIRWGGDWDGDFDFRDQNFNDLPHFELIKTEGE